MGFGGTLPREKTHTQPRHVHSVNGLIRRWTPSGIDALNDGC